MPDYSKGKIYTIRNRNDPSKVYVGSTIQALAVRFGGHKKHSEEDKRKNIKLYVEVKNDWSDWYIELYENYPCNNREELHKREGEIIREIGNLNMIIAGRNCKEYREENKEKNKEYREINKEKIKEYKTKYYKEHKEQNQKKEQKKQKEWYEKNKETKLQKSKKYNEENKDKLAEYYKKYREENKEKERKRNKKWYEKNKDKNLNIITTSTITVTDIDNVNF